MQLERKPIKLDTYVHTSPYNGSWLQNFYNSIATNLYGRKIVTEPDFREQLAQHDFLPELMIMGNFVADRSGITSICHDLDINIIYTEDGFFPHYSTMHADPFGFCWESSLTRLIFRGCLPKQRENAKTMREQWLDFKPEKLPEAIRQPFVLWPTQLIMDRVNRWDLHVSNWAMLISHFRNSLPESFQLVIKEHPRSTERDLSGVREIARDLPNTIIVPRSTNLKTLLSTCSGVAGANSSVLYEARLMFHKPVYAYARGWFTNHTDLFLPVYRTFAPRELNRVDWLEDNRLMRTDYLDDYTDWFLAQLLSRQITRDQTADSLITFKKHVHHLSYASYLEHGEDIFLVA